MPLKKSADELVITESDSDPDIVILLDTSPDPAELVVRDESNSTDLFRIPAGTPLADTLAQNGENAISQGVLSPQDPTEHGDGQHDGTVPSDPHGNESHSKEYVTSDEVGIKDDVLRGRNLQRRN